jgi:hypothetical protein
MVELPISSYITLLELISPFTVNSTFGNCVFIPTVELVTYNVVCELFG